MRSQKDESSQTIPDEPCLWIGSIFFPIWMFPRQPAYFSFSERYTIAHLHFLRSLSVLLLLLCFWWRECLHHWSPSHPISRMNPMYPFHHLGSLPLYHNDIYGLSIFSTLQLPFHFLSVQPESISRPDVENWRSVPWLAHSLELDDDCCCSKCWRSWRSSRNKWVVDGKEG